MTKDKEIERERKRESYDIYISLLCTRLDPGSCIIQILFIQSRDYKKDIYIYLYKLSSIYRLYLYKYIKQVYNRVN